MTQDKLNREVLKEMYKVDIKGVYNPIDYKTWLENKLIELILK